jgi:UDP-N-acetylglucosamine acyltransferase
VSTVATSIHPTAIIHPTAKIAEGAQIGPYVVIGEDTVIREGVQVGPHAVIEFADIGERCRIHASAFVGTAPQDLKYRDERTRLTLGADCLVRECVTLNRGTAATGLTRIGSRCLFMAYSHVAHDCIIGDEVIVANSVAIAGHCEVGDFTVLGGMVGLHQFVRVGKMAMVGAGAMVPLDIPPYTMAQGDRAKLSGLNVVGLKRRDYPADQVSDLKKAYFEIFDSPRTFKEQVTELQRQTRTPPVQEFLSFLASSHRGITRPASRKTDSADAA